MDDELRKALATLSGQISDVDRNQQSLGVGHKEILIEVRTVGGKVEALGNRVGRLEKHVFGSEPPPAPPTRPMAESLNEHDGDIAHLTGQILAAGAKIEQLTEMQQRQTAILERLDKIAANPTVRRLAYAVASLVIGYAAAKGLVLK